MSPNLFGIFRDYPTPPESGFWGAPTSTIDWCEENYVISPYIAEWSNTLTNSGFILLALYLLYSSWKNKLETRFKLVCAGFGLVGIGSWLFHMTLQYKYQLLDELPMVYATCIPAWSIFCEEIDVATSRIRSPTRRKQWTVGLTIFMGANLLTAIYLIFKNPTIHQAGYALINAIVIWFAFKLTTQFVNDPVAKRNLQNAMLLGITIFLAGYFVWQLDVHFCQFWITIRRSYLRLPLGVLLELHGWWHLLTGLGVYFYIVYLEYLRIYIHGKRDEYEMIWRWKLLPEVVIKTSHISTPFSHEFLGSCVTTTGHHLEERSKSE
ncbi:Ydc1/Ypc1 [Kluyveromyces lactis]|nr:Ydc1/Ypc1 [Kluyveromyces lactis]